MRGREHFLAILLMRAAAVAPALDRLVVEVLARTRLRVGELCALEANAVVRIGATYWLKVPIGKLHNDRYLPLHPLVVELLGTWRSEKVNQDKDLLITDHGRPLDRHGVGRIVKRTGQAAGVGHVHPHRLRHTLATQAEMSDDARTASFGMVRDQEPIRVLGFVSCSRGSELKRDIPAQADHPPPEPHQLQHCVT